MKPAKAITTVKPIRNTKILAKIADNRASTDFLKMIFDAGANVAWMNTAHQNEEDTLKVINTKEKILFCFHIQISIRKFQLDKLYCTMMPL